MSIDAICATIASYTREINKLDDVLSALIKTIEDSLIGVISLKVGVPQQDNRTFVFAKYNSRWMFAFENGPRVTPLLNAPRNDRVSVFLEGTVQKLLESTPVLLQREFSRRQEAIQLARELFENISKKGP